MCGICGIINYSNKQVSEVSLKNMMALMKHRGPDDEGIVIENNLGLGFVRLSILDLSSAGHQPMSSNDNRYTVVFNGEIYNYIELREELKKLGHFFKTDTDTEVLIEAYAEWGEDCLHHFNGMWAFVIYDRTKKTVFASRDRFGIKPFYYLQTEHFFAFSSEISPLLNLLPEKASPDYQSIFEYLAFNRTDQTEQTFFSGIKKLQHGHKFSISLDSPPKGGINGGTVWYNLKKEVEKSKGFNSPAEFKELFSSSIGLHLRSDVPVGVCLSGGLDSSSIVSVLLNDYNKKDLNTFSAVYNAGQSGDETEYIKIYEPLLKNMFYITPSSQSLKADLKTFVKVHAEPIPSTAPYAQYKVMELAKGKVVVTLDGQGADEELAGYHYFYGFYFKDLLLKVKLITLLKEIYFYISKHKSLFGIKTFFFFLMPGKFRTAARVNEKKYINDSFVRKYKNGKNISGNLYGSRTLKEALLNHFEYKLEHLLKWEDRNSMHFSIEARVPFLDYRLVEKTLASSEGKFIHNGMTKHLLREGMKGILPEKIRLRKDKIGFETPQDEWFKTKEWQDIVFEILNSDSLKQRKIIDTETALKLYQSHIKGETNIAKEIWKWIHLELWFREFID